MFRADHPYATGFRVTDASGQATSLDPGQPLRLAGEEGAHELAVAVTTRYGALTPQPLEYVVNYPGLGELGRPGRAYARFDRGNTGGRTPDSYRPGRRLSASFPGSVLTGLRMSPTSRAACSATVTRTRTSRRPRRPPPRTSPRWRKTPSSSGQTPPPTRTSSDIRLDHHGLDGGRAVVHALGLIVGTGVAGARTGFVRAKKIHGAAVQLLRYKRSRVCLQAVTDASGATMAADGDGT